jgi:hypothetical protein
MPGSYRASIGHNPKILVKKQSVALAGQDIALTEAPGGGVMAQTFGNWWQMPRPVLPLAQSTRINTYYPQMYTTGNSAFKGNAVQWYWRQFETVQGNAASIGVPLIVAECNALRAMNPPRKLMIQFREEKQNTTLVDHASVMFPDYLNATGNPAKSLYQYTISGKTTISFDYTISAANTAYLNMWTTLINGLKADANAWATIEGFRPFHETGDERHGSQISATQFQAHIEETVAHIRSLAPDKMIWVNCTGGLNNKAAFLNTIKNIYVLPGHGDTLPRAANGTGTGSGADRDITGDSASPLNIDYRISSAIVMAVEGSEMGSGAFPTNAGAADYTLLEHWNYLNTGASGNAIPVLPVYIFWDAYEGSASTADTDYSIAEIRDFVHAHPTLANTAKPASYP